MTMSIPVDGEERIDPLVATRVSAVGAGLRRWKPGRYGGSLFRVYRDAEQVIAGQSVSELGYLLPSLEELAPHMAAAEAAGEDA